MTKLRLILACGALATFIGAGLAGCQRSDSGGDGGSPAAAVSSTQADYPADLITGVITVTRDDDDCDVAIEIHNRTKYHLKEAGLGVTGLDPTFSVGETIAGGDNSASQSIPVPSGGSCLAMARSIEQHATDNNVGTCTMDGATEGDCQKMFSFTSGIDGQALQKSIDDVKAGTLPVGTTIRPVQQYAGFDAMVQPDGDRVQCPANEHADWGQTATIMAVHADGDGVADAYEIQGSCMATDPTGPTTVDEGAIQGWVSRRAVESPTASSN